MLKTSHKIYDFRIIWLTIFEILFKKPNFPTFFNIEEELKILGLDGILKS